MRDKHIKALAWAVEEAAAWRGYFTGNPDPEPLVEFDKRVKAAKDALTAIRKEHRETVTKRVGDKHEDVRQNTKL